MLSRGKKEGNRNMWLMLKVERKTEKVKRET